MASAMLGAGAPAERRKVGVEVPLPEPEDADEAQTVESGGVEGPETGSAGGTSTARRDEGVDEPKEPEDAPTGGSSVGIERPGAGSAGSSAARRGEGVAEPRRKRPRGCSLEGTVGVPAGDSGGTGRREAGRRAGTSAARRENGEAGEPRPEEPEESPAGGSSGGLERPMAGSAASEIVAVTVATPTPSPYLGEENRPPVALVLGMTDITEDQSTKLKRHEPPWRDFSRLRALEKFGYRVFTISKGNEDLETRCSHFRHEFSARGGKATRKELEGANAKVDAIFLDYFRFPADYMRHAYQYIPQFLVNILPACSPNAKVFVPVLRHAAAPFFAYWAVPTRTSPEDHHLSKVTASLDKQDYLGGYSNPEQLLHLRDPEPFDALPIQPIIDCPAETLKTRYF